MIQLIQIISKGVIYSIVFICMMSCSDDFLNSHENQTIVTVDTTISLLTRSSQYQYTVNIPGLSDSFYSIGNYPKWMYFDYLVGGFINGSTVLTFTIGDIPETFALVTEKSEITLVIDNYGIYVIEIYFTGSRGG